MDPSKWMDPYSHHLRQVASSTSTATRNHQLMNNAVCQSQQMMTQNRNGLHHHVAAAAAVAASSVNTLPSSNNCQQQSTKNLIISNATKTNQKQQQHQMNQYGTKTLNQTTAVETDHQSFINSHHYRSTNCSPWLFHNSRQQQQHTNHIDNSSSSSSYDINGHTDNAASNVPSFNSNPFAGHLPPPPHHHSGVYDTNFAAAAAAAASFAAHQQSQTSTKSSANQYLSSMASEFGFMDPTTMTMNNKSNVVDNSSNYKNGMNGPTSVEPIQSSRTSVKGMNNMHATSNDSFMDSASSLRDYHNGFFCSHSLQPSTNGWHQNFSNNNGHVFDHHHHHQQQQQQHGHVMNSVVTPENVINTTNSSRVHSNNINVPLSNCMTPHGLPTCPSSSNKVNSSTTSNQHLLSTKSHHNNNKSDNNQNLNNNTANSLNTNNHHQKPYQNGNTSSTAALSSHSFPNIHQAPLQSKYDLMQNLSSSMNSSNRNSHNYHHTHQNSLVDPSGLGVKFAQAAAQAHDHYTAACLAAAQAIHHQNNEYAAFQQQQQQHHHQYNHPPSQQQQQQAANNVNHKSDSTASHVHHQQYMSSAAMNNAYAAAAAAAHNHHHHNGNNCYQSSDYPTQLATNFKRGSTNHQQNFLNYPSPYLFPTITHPHHTDDFPMNSNPFKTHHHSNLFFTDDVYTPCISETNNVYHNHHQQQQPPPQQQQHQTTSTSSKSSSKTRKNNSSQKVNNNKLNSLYQPEFVANSTNSCTPTPVANINGSNCCLANQSPITNSNNNTISSNNCASHSRCSSVASTHSGHAQQQQQPSIVTNDTYNYNYPSPVTTNLSGHSPFQQTRSSTSNSSHSSINSSCALSTATNGSQNIQSNSVNGGTGVEYSNYGTPNSAPPFQTSTTTIGNVSQTPTPTPGYPTPPSSVGHSNSRCNSNEELSPFSNNSMSSNMSHQSYGRNDYNKSTSSCGSQISPKQVNNNIDSTSNMSESLSNFSSCMVAAAAQQQNTSNQPSQQSSPNLYTSNVMDNNAYKSPQYYSINNGASVTSMSSSDSAETTGYGNYVDPSNDSSLVGQLATTTNQTSSTTIKLQMDDQTSTLTSYDFNSYSESNSENSFGHNSYPEASKAKLSSCIKNPEEQHLQSSDNSLLICHENNKNNEYLQQQDDDDDDGIVDDEDDDDDDEDDEEEDDNEKDDFNLSSFESVIQPIVNNVDLYDSKLHPQRPSPHSDQQQSSNIVQTININDGVMEPEAVSFESTIDELNFIPSRASTTSTSAAAIDVIQNDKSSDNYANQPQQITTMTFQESSHDTNIPDNRVINDESRSTTVATEMSCNVSIESLIDSLPKPECHLPTVDKSNNTGAELISHEVVRTADTNKTVINEGHHHNQHADIFLSDLAPLMNDNSKIALMESTFKRSIETTVQEHTNVANGNGATFDKIQKSLFDDHQLPTVEFNHKPNKSTSSQPSVIIPGAEEDPDNQFRDVDEFLKSNYKESPVNPTDTTSNSECRNESIDTKVTSAMPISHSSKQIDQDSSIPIIQQVSNDQLTSPQKLSSLPSSIETSISNSQARKSSSKNTHSESISKSGNQSNDTKKQQKHKTLTNKRKLDTENINKDDVCTIKKSKKDNSSNSSNKLKSRCHSNDQKSKKAEKNKNNPVESNTNDNTCLSSTIEKDKQDTIVVKTKKAKTVNTPQIFSANHTTNKDINNSTIKSITDLSNENQRLILPVLSSIMPATKNNLTKNKNEKKKVANTQNITNNKRKQISCNFEVKNKNLAIQSKVDKKSVKSGKNDKKPAKNNVKQLSTLDKKSKISSSCSEVKENCNKNIPTTTSITMATIKSLPILSSNSISSLSMNDKSIPIAPKDISNNHISNIQNSLKLNSIINNKKLAISHQPSQQSSKTKNDCNKKESMNKKPVKNHTSENKPLLPSPSISTNKLNTTTVAAKVKNDLSNLSQTITTKPRVSLVTNNNNTNQQQALISPNLFNASQCLNAAKPSAVNPPTLTNVTPTLIVNQGHHSVQPYQVSPMTNAVLISIHPANTTPIPSLTAQSFIALNTQSVASSTTSNTTTTTIGCSPNSSRRRSQDKKISTIREGLMRTGDFVVAEEEAHLDLPVIWRIEGKSLLQRFEPSEQNGITIYINTSSYSAWNPTVRQKYLGLDVRIMGCNRTRIVVEKIGLTRNKNESHILHRDVSSINEKENNSLPTDSSPSNVTNCFENFEVLIQTLISQALDPNFIAEIVKENDDYFLSHMQAIEEVCHSRRTRFIAKFKWDSVILKNFETFTNIQINKQNNVGDLRCRSCHDNWSTKILYFDGEPYNRDTLEKLSNDAIVAASTDKKVKIAVCDNCTEKIFLFSKLYHHRLNFFLLCKAKVEEIQSKDANKESHIILHECLQDNVWMKKIFQELETLLYTCDSQC
ncbi:uncharacterized protein LOC113789186 isoform X1 [Dermatophagoides pteronyssinus]|uniref:uncharacterized protein LOC113789186 isoform X1 n=1 Tax=Dermatophagoides pteronyssinus TaxID=6956 RepID=UPI003F663A60